MTSGIYSITNQINGHQYIGSAVNLRKRQMNHWFHLRRGTHDNPHLQRAWAKYREHAFVFEILHIVHVSTKLVALEQRVIDHLKPVYNIRRKANSNLGIRYSAATKKKISMALKGRTRSVEQIQQMSGRPCSIETRRKIGTANSGRKHSLSARMKMSEQRRGVPISNAHRRKIGDALRGRQRQPFSRTWRQRIGAASKGNQYALGNKGNRTNHPRKEEKE